MEMDSSSTPLKDAQLADEQPRPKESSEARPRVVLHIRIHLRPDQALPIETIPRRRCEKLEDAPDQRQALS